jgi:hypothetical protein
VATLEELAAREMLLLERARLTIGTMEERFEHLRRDGSFAESAEVHSLYVTLARERSDLEALKRAVFLGWYEAAEPGCFTGIGGLDPHKLRLAHELLEVARIERRIDTEFAGMLGWYWAISDYYFEASSPESLVSYLSRLDPKGYKAVGFTEASLKGRGQMGSYLRSAVLGVA